MFATAAYYVLTVNEKISSYRWDYDNKLATELQSQERDGDPDAEGIVWHRYSRSCALCSRCRAPRFEILTQTQSEGDNMFIHTHSGWTEILIQIHRERDEARIPRNVR